jgi:integrase
MPLTVLKVAHAKPGRHCDGRGLYLIVRPSGAKSWIARIQRDGKRRDFGLGSVYDVSLEEARLALTDYRRKMRAGVDPARERIRPKRVVPSFETVARDCFEAMRGGWKNGQHNAWMPSLETYVFPRIGKLPVDEVDAKAVLGVLEPIWLVIPDTAKRIRQRIGSTLDYAHIKGHIPEELSLRSVTHGLPRQTRQVVHRPAMPYEQVPAFMKRLMAEENSIGRDALKLIMLTAVRSNEARFAVWREIDLDAATWSIPAKRMKMKEAHVVPLSPPAVALLKRLRTVAMRLDGRLNPERIVFSAWTGKAISETTILKAMRDLEIAVYTVHGFRSTFTDWTAETTDFPKEVADKALAHRIPNAVEAAYRRTDFFAKRRTLMDEWGAFVMG